MRVSIALSLCAVMLLCGAAQAERTTSFRPSLAGGLWFGETSYEAEHATNYPGISFGYKLVYPLDVATAGVGLQYVILTDGVTEWTFSARLLTSVTDPGNLMTDRDWTTYLKHLQVDGVYTESDVSGKLTSIDFEATRLLATNGCISLSVLAGVGYQKISQDILNFSGVLFDDSGYAREFGYSEQAGTYDVSYLKPQIGFVPRFNLGSGVSAELKAAVSMVRVSDEDNHMLRYFRSKSSGWGIGGTGRLAFQYDFPAAANGRTPFVRLSGEYMTLKADLEETRTWYGDDPAGEDDETGQSMTGLPHDVRSTQYGAQLQFGVAF
jgi:hypothetical protein